MAGLRVGDIDARLGIDTSDYDKGLKHAESKASGFVSSFKSAMSTAVGFTAAIAGTQAIAAGFDVIKSSIFGMNSTLETTQLQFKKLYESGDKLSVEDAAAKAKQQVKDLFAFAGATPFETGPIIQASRMMQTFGGSTLNTMDNLRLFGDAAAGTSSDISEVAFWSSRAYSAMQSGKPFGEASMRLMELGIMSGTTANKLSEMSEKGASSSDMWKVMTTDMSKFSGSMKEQAGTWSGLTSTFKDTIQLGSAKIFEPLFVSAKSVLDKTNTLLSSDKATAFISNLTAKVSSGLSATGAIISSGIGGIINTFKQSESGMYGFHAVLEKIFGSTTATVITSTIGIIISMVQALIGIFTGNLSAINGFQQALAMVFGPTFGEAVSIVFGFISKGIGIVVSAFQILLALFSSGRESIAAFTTMLGSIVGEEAAKLIATGISNFLPAVTAGLELLVGVYTAVGKRIVEIYTAYIGTVRDILVSIVRFVIDNWSTISSTAKTIWDAVSLVVTTVVATIISTVSTVAQTIQDNWSTISSTAKSIWDTVSSTVTTVITTIIDKVKSIAETIQDNWSTISSTAKSIWDSVSSVVTTVVTTIIDKAKSVVELIRDNWSTIESVARTIFDGVKTVVMAVFDAISTEVKELVTFFRTNWDQIKEATSNVFKGILIVIGAFVLAAMTFWKTFGDEITAVTKIAWDIIKGVIDGAMDIIKGIFKVVISLLTGDWKGALEGAGTVVDGLAKIVNSIVEGAFKIFWEIIKSVADVLAEKFEPAISGIRTGLGLLRGAVDSVTDGIGWLLDKAKSAASVLDKLPFMPHSPPPMVVGLDMVADAIGPVVSELNRLESASRSFALMVPKTLQSDIWAADSKRITDEITRLNLELANATPYSLHEANIKRDIDILNAWNNKVQLQITLFQSARTALDGFNAAIDRNAVLMHNTAQFSKPAQSAGAGQLPDLLQRALSSGDAGSGEALFTALQTTIDALKPRLGTAWAGIAQYITWQFQYALQTGSVQAVDQAFGALNDAFAYNVPTLQSLIDRTVSGLNVKERLGSKAFEIWDTVNTTIKVGGDTALQTLATSMAGFRQTLFSSLPAEQAGAAWSLIMQRVNEAVTEGTPETLERLRATLNQYAGIDRLMPEGWRQAPEVMRLWMQTNAQAALDGGKGFDVVAAQNAAYLQIMTQDWTNFPAFVQTSIESYATMMDTGVISTADFVNRSQALMTAFRTDWDNLPSNVQASLTRLKDALDRGELDHRAFVNRSAAIVKGFTRDLDDIPPALRGIYNQIQMNTENGVAGASQQLNNFVKLIGTIPEEFDKLPDAMRAAWIQIIQDVISGVATIEDAINRINSMINSVNKVNGGGGGGSGGGSGSGGSLSGGGSNGRGGYRPASGSGGGFTWNEISPGVYLYEYAGQDGGKGSFIVNAPGPEPNAPGAGIPNAGAGGPPPDPTGIGGSGPKGPAPNPSASVASNRNMATAAISSVGKSSDRLDESKTTIHNTFKVDDPEAMIRAQESMLWTIRQGLN